MTKHKSSLKLELSAAAAICRAVDSPRALTVYLLINSQEYEQLTNLEINPDHYLDPGSYADDALVTGLLKKSVNLPLNIDRKAVALKSFLDAELRNRELNSQFSKGVPPDRWDVVRAIKPWVDRLLGPLNRSALDRITSLMKHGSGATTGVAGHATTLSQKYDANMHLTESLYPFYKSLLGGRWWEHQSKPRIVEGNELFTVPKNSKTDRAACKEGTLNVYCQLGVGRYLKGRLRDFGIDLYDQGRNQGLAQQAFVRRLATIDLSNASNSIAYNVVRELFPRDWFELLDLLRSPKCGLPLPGKPYITLEMMSSMGNGYTFEVETVIFLATVLSCVGTPSDVHYVPDNIGVYGDDIIVPQNIAEVVIERLEALGFQVNGEKSFLAGSFFESCGADFFQGRNVRPFYLRKSEEDAGVPYALQIANALRRWARQRNGIEDLQGCDPRFVGVWTWLKDQIPHPWCKARVPASFGDIGLLSSELEALAAGSVKFPKGQLEGWFVKTVAWRPKQRRSTRFGLLLMNLATHYQSRLPPYHLGADGALFQKGKEPVRGLFGRLVSKLVLARFEPGWDWGS